MVCGLNKSSSPPRQCAAYWWCCNWKRRISFDAYNYRVRWSVLILECVHLSIVSCQMILKGQSLRLIFVTFLSSQTWRLERQEDEITAEQLWLHGIKICCFTIQFMRYDYLQQKRLKSHLWQCQLVYALSESESSSAALVMQKSNVPCGKGGARPGGRPRPAPLVGGKPGGGACPGRMACGRPRFDWLDGRWAATMPLRPW